MQNTASSSKPRDRAAYVRSARTLAGWLGVLSLVAASATADDRDLLRLSQSGSADPYVFIIFDTSGSMSATPACSQADTFNDIDPFDAMCTQECTLDDATCARICPSLGCREYAIPDPDNPIVELEEIIIDADSTTTSGVTVVGPWFPFSGLTPFKGARILIENNGGEKGTPHESVIYDPSIVNSGTYMIYMSYPNSTVLATNVMVDVTHADGDSTVFMNQSITVDSGAGTDFDGWNLIGTFELDASDTDTGTVVIRNEAADFFVAADAIRWVRIEVPPCLDPTDLIYRCQQPLCQQGDCWTALNGDDPNSKFYQAKQALSEAIDSVGNVHFGFGSYEQDNARLHTKHWLYRVREKIPPADTVDQIFPMLGTTPLLEAGDDEVFGNYSTSGDPTPTGFSIDFGPPITVDFDGDGYNCYTIFGYNDPPPEADTSLRDQQVGCNFDNPVDITDDWEAIRGHRIPKLGYAGGFATEIWYRTGYSQLYKARYTSTGDTYGSDTFSASIEVASCASDGTCDPFDPAVTVYYDRVSDYAANEGATLRNPLSSGGYFYNQANSQSLDGIQNNGPDVSTCFGLEPNDDSDFDDNGTFETDDIDTRDDLWYDYSFKWPTTQDSRGDDLDLNGTADSPRRDVFDVGDRIPLDWQTDNRDEIQRRLAPNIVDGGAPLDFRVATYFENAVGPLDSSNDGTKADDPLHRRLRLVNDETDGDTTDDERPLVARGQTPLGESLADFKVWYAGSEDIAAGDSADDPKYQGWADVAAVLDTDFPCRQKFILMLTDGIDTCYRECQDPAEERIDECRCVNPPSCTTMGPPGCVTEPELPCVGDYFENDSCDMAGDLFNQEQVATYVVGFGVSEGSSLDCIAANGGTEEPLLPRNKEELVEALESVLADVQAEQRTFASASIPAVQSTAADKIFLSSFTPVPFDPLAVAPANPAPGFWPGRIDAFRAPLPLTADNRPDVDRKCESVDMASANLQAACHLWEAGKVLCEQAAAGERKVLYGMEHTDGLQIPGAGRPGTLRELKVPQYLGDNPGLFYDASHPDLPLVEDLAEIFISPGIWFLYRFGLFFNNGDIDAILSRYVDQLTGIKDLPLDLIGQIDACDTDGDDMADAFVMGDIFHASPVAISGPSNFTYFANDQCGPAQRLDIPNNCVSPTDLAVDEDRGYRRFAADHVWRRRMLAAPTNDGQLHVFDTGLRQLVDNDFTTTANDTVELFNDGSGNELFAYMPRMVLTALKEQVDGEDHVYSMDGTITVADVFIDPGDGDGGSATELDRAWRTVLVSGLREGGDIYPDANGVDYFKSGYYALDITQPDAVVARSASTDPTLVPCKTAGCSESVPPDDEYPPSCLVLDAQGLVDEASDCPYRIDPAPPEDPQFPAELWTFKDSWLVEYPTSSGEFLEFYLDEDSDGDPFDPADDDNGYGVPDLADTWSRPVITQVAVCPEGKVNCVFGKAPDASDPNPDGSDLVTKHVAIFGGGMDPANKSTADPSELRGAYLYMVDLETGFPIYKRRLCPDAAAGVCGTGSVAADPTVLDTDRDGIADAVYIGTTDGYFYKVKLSTDVGDVVPYLEAIDIENGQLIRNPSGDDENFETWADTPFPTLSATASAMATLCGAADPCAPRVLDAAWDPFPILDTGDSPIYYASSAFLVPERNQFAFTIGTGDREDLWSTPSEGGAQARFFTIVDEDFTPADINSIGPCIADGTDPGLLPITKDCLVSYTFTAEPFDSDFNLLTELVDSMTALPTGVDIVTEPMRPGWAMRFPTSDPLQNRVTSEAFAVSGVLVFSIFDPNIVSVSSGDDDDDDATRQCGRSGTTRAFVVLASNGSPLVNLSSLGSTGEGSLSDDDDDSSGDDDDDELTARDRYQEIGEFTTAPQVVRRQTPNKPGEDGKTIQDAIDDQLRSSFRQAVLDHLPRGSRFNEAFEMVIVALRNSTGVNVYASIPIAIYPADWRDQ